MDPVLIDIPEQLESERLILRAPRPGEGAAINAAVMESIAELQPWMPWANPAPTVEQSEASARKAAARYLTREELTMRLLLKSTGEIIGSSGLTRIDWKIPKFEIGYWVRTSRAGQGYITECVQTLTAFAFEDLKANRLEIRAGDRNERSWRVAERAGYTLEGILRNDSRGPDGRLRDTRIYAKVAGD
jgi:RimJ/RimL family protein N-acetyltransferase